MPTPLVNEPQTPDFISRPWILWAGFIWGLAEATLFFIVPDVLLTLVALYSFPRSAKVLACILLGALVGGTLIFYLGAYDATRARAIVQHVPFVSGKMFATTHESFERDGIWALIKGPGNGIPYKVYAAQSSRYSSWPLFLAVSTVARMERFALFWLIASILGLIMRKSIRRQPRIAAVVHACIWIAGYSWYWSAI